MSASAQEIAKEIIEEIEGGGAIDGTELAHLNEVYAPFASAKAALESFQGFLSKKYNLKVGDDIDLKTGKITRKG